MGLHFESSQLDLALDSLSLGLFLTRWDRYEPVAPTVPKNSIPGKMFLGPPMKINISSELRRKFYAAWKRLTKHATDHSGHTTSYSACLDMI